MVTEAEKCEMLNLSVLTALKMSLIPLLMVFSLCITESIAAGCTYLSADARCGECDVRGHCIRGSVPIDPWLSFALKTQRDLQLDEPFFNVQLLDSHNAFNTRADNYGGNDTCAWPPPYKRPCWAFANQEFSFTDMLNMGIRGLEIDNYWCNNDIRMAHIGSDLKLLCFERTKTFAQGMEEIGDWLKKQGNVNELIRIFLNKVGSERPDIVNNALLDNFGNRILTPSELQSRYGGVWPTMRTMKADGNNVVVLISSGNDLGGITINKAHWTNRQFGSFTAYPICGGKVQGTTWRLYGDGTHYPVFWDGPTETGVTTDLTEVMKCHIQYPAMDFINQQLLKTGVFTWAAGEPSQALDKGSCIYLSGSDQRWHVASSCAQIMFFACQHTVNKDMWMLSKSTGRYSLSDTDCPSQYTFSIPQNGYRHQKLIELIEDKNVWINYSPWLPGYVPPEEEPHHATTPQSSSPAIKSPFMIWIVLISIILFQRF